MRLGTPSPERQHRVEEGLSTAHLGPGARNRLGDYELLEEIARGGMGVVYRARQISLKREVAVKVLLAGEFATEASIKRFRREAEAAASLNHPNIVSIYEVGEQEGQPFFSMELIQGRSLEELAGNKPLPARQAAQLVKTIAEAVHFAHQRGLLHRDLKPSNVLVDNSRVPHITDFGLAKRTEPGVDLTSTGQVLGTPNYMPPEQADPKRGQPTAASDVYSLGALLYHLLTGRAPFLSDSVQTTLRQVLEQSAVSLRLLNPALPRNLETICQKCLNKEPARRYPIAQELAEDLGRWLAGKPILARPTSSAEKLWRWCRRNPALAIAVATSVTLLLTVAIGSPIALVHIDSERRRAEEAGHEMRRQLYTALLEQARSSVRKGELGHRFQALEAIRKASAITNAPELRREALSALALPDMRYERELATGPDFKVVELDPTLRRLARCRGNGPVEILSATDARLMATLPASTPGSCIFARWSYDGRFLAVKREQSAVGETPALEVWDLAATRQVLLARDGDYRGMAFHPRLPRLMAGTPDGTLVLWDLQAQREIKRFTLPAPPGRMLPDGPKEKVAPTAIIFSPDGERFAVGYDGRSKPVSIHRSSDGAQLALAVVTNQVTDMDWHPEGRWIGVTDFGGSVYVIDSHTGESRWLGRHKAQAAEVTFSPDGGYLLTGGWEREQICWDLSSMGRAFSIALNSFSAQFSSDGSRCGITTRFGFQIYLFERPCFHRELPEVIHGQARYAAFSPDDRWLAVSTGERLGVCDLASEVPVVWAEKGGDSRVFFSSTGELIASREGACCCWQVLPGTNAGAPPLLRELPLSEPTNGSSLCPVSNALALTSTNGSRLISAGNLTGGESDWVQTPAGINGASPDGRWLAIFEPFTPVLHVYRLPDLRPIAHLTNRLQISTFEFSPQGEEIAVATRANVEFWSTATWQRTGELTNFTALFFAPRHHGWWLTSGFRSGGLYDTRTRQPLFPLPTGTLPLALSLDGRFLAVSVEARSLQVWDLVKVRQRFRELGLDWGIDDK